MDKTSWFSCIVHAADSEAASNVANVLENELNNINIKIHKSLFKDFKTVNDIEQEHVFYIFIISSYCNGKKSRSIRRFQRKLDKTDEILSKLLFCVISLNDAQNESNKMYLTLKNERKSIAFYKNEIIVYHSAFIFDDLLSSISQFISLNKFSVIKSKPHKESIVECDDIEYDFTICYGTVTGNSKEICNEIVSIAISKNSKYVICGPIELNKVNLRQRTHYLIIVISTTGDGEIPSNADILYRKLKGKSYKLNDIAYAVLGLGDSNYSQFNAAAKKMDKLLSLCGAHKFYHTGYGDDGLGLEDVVEPWKYGVINEMQRKLYGVIDTNNYTSNDDNIIYNYQSNIVINQIKFRISRLPIKMSPKLCRYQLFDDKSYKSISYKAYDSSNPFLVDLVSAKYLTQCSAKERCVIQLTLRLPHGFSYEIGDVLCIYPPNPEFMVNALLNRLRFNGNDVIKILSINETISTNPLHHIPFKKEITIYDIFRFCIDIRSIPRSKLFMKSLSTFCSNCEDKLKLLSLKLKNKKIRTIFELLNAFKSCYPSLECLLHFLSELKPRQYSICSSPNYAVDTVDICFRVLMNDDIHYNGLCSCFMYSLCCNESHLLDTVYNYRYNYGYIEDKIAVSLKLSPTFKPPSNPRSSLIMIGPGTGVAVFRAFLQHRYQQRINIVNNNTICDGAWRGIHMLFDDETAQNREIQQSDIKQSKCVLFFGCHHPKKDYLFKTDWHQFQENGVLDHLLVAFSRYYENKVYVQHLLKENSLLISNMILNDNAYIFVCGDAKKMAKDVENTIIELIALHSKMSLNESTKYVQNMKRTNKYNIDVWNSIMH